MQQTPNTHQWTNWDTVFSARSVRQLSDATIEVLGELISVLSLPR
jgi:hypothetical protein